MFTYIVDLYYLKYEFNNLEEASIFAETAKKHCKEDTSVKIFIEDCEDNKKEEEIKAADVIQLTQEEDK